MLWRLQRRNRLQQKNGESILEGVVATLQKFQIADAYAGRSVKVRPGRFTEAVRDFERILVRNQVKFTYKATERHEKKGPKRRRIRSEQWRKHFANQVRKNVQLVHKIRRRGCISPDHDHLAGSTTTPLLMSTVSY
ncbi:Glycerol-3-phosphate o-acyltransferase [Mycena venus]|uniref:Glycerol-3-phosphate o-acyltransferase n=1 Tax=Mycena venus TaxID=2733690 RepID=A0A8H6XD04_9AGAR|nr:Glycerol-3-phosphate o-acyltransferase [Mycena venus]